MRDFLRYLFVVAAMLMVIVGDVWAECYVLNASEEKTFNCSLGGDDVWYEPEALLGPGSQLTFEAKKEYVWGVGGVGNVEVQEYVNGGWNTIVEVNPGKNYSQYGPFTLSRNATKIRFFNTYGSYKRYFKNVKVTQATYADQPSATSWPADSKIIGSPAETTTITMAWSNTAAFSCEITGGGKDRFSAEITEGNASTCSYGTAKILVKYKHDVVGTHNASLRISNGTYTYNIALSGTTLPKYTATFNWLLQDSYYVGDEKILLDEVYSLVDKDGNNIKNQFHSSIQFSSSDPNIVAIENGKLVAKNAGEAKITAYFPGTNEWFGFSKEINLTIKKRPTSFNLIALSSCYTGDEFVLTSLFSAATNNPEVALEYISGDESILKVEDGKLIAVCAGTTTFTVRQQENYKWLGHSQTLTITVNKYNSNFNLLQTQYTRKIGEVITEAQLYTHSNTEILPTVVSDNPAVVSFNASTRQLEAKTAGQAIITISQPEDCKWTHYNVTCTVTVQKHTPVFTWNDPVYFNQALIEDYFATSNKDTKISIINQRDREVADLYFSTSDPSDLHTLDLTTYNKGASTKVTVSQEENWYWYAKSEEHTITPIDPNNHVPFVIDSEERRNVFDVNWKADGYAWDNGIQLGDWTDGGSWADKYVDIEFRGVPDKLTFNTSVKDAGLFPASDIYWYVKESEDGVNWSGEIWNEKGIEDITITDSIQLQPKTRFIRLCYSGNFGGVFHNITVTEREEFHAVDNSDNEVEHLYFDANQVFTDKTLSFNLKYANAGYKVKVESNDSRFTVNPTSLNTIGGCKYGKENISVTYRSTIPYETTGNNSYIVISDELAELNGHRDTVYLHASSYKPTQQLEWRADFKAVDKPTVRVKDGEITNAATASSGLPVTYMSSDTTVIAVRNAGTVLLPKTAGEATITALQAGNETWQPVGPITKNFIVTDKIIQYIVWSDDLTDLIVGGDNVNLTAKVYLQNEETKQWEEHPELTEKLVYSVENTSVVSVAGNVLSIRSIGQTTATVTALGNTDYAVATLTKPVRVRSAAAGCEDVLLLNHRDEVRFFAYNLDQIVQGEFAIDHTKGVPGTLSFQHSGASWDLGIQYYAGKIRAEYNTTDDSNWVLAKEVTPTEDQTNLEFDIPLPRNASKIRFVRPAGGQGYHYVSNIQVHPAQYIEAVETIDLGEIHVGSIEDTTFVVNYANIKDDVYLTASSGTVTTNPTSFGEQCGEFGTKTITVQWIPSEVNANAQETVTLTDGVSRTTCVVKLIANVTPGTQNLYWQDRPTVISNCGDIEFPEQTTAHIGIIWEVVSGQEVADFVDGRLELYKSGTIIVRGYNAGNANYHPFEITYTFTINYDPVFLGTEDTDWNNVDNWNICRLPNENDIVTIKALVELVTHEKVKGMKFAENGKMHIAHNAGMTIGSHGLELTTNGLITIDNTPDGAGFLKVDPNATNKPNGKVTIKYITKAYNSGVARDEIWQYMGAPGKDMDIVADEDKTLIYHWSEQNGWEKQASEQLTPFAGYVFTQNKGTASSPQAEFDITATPIVEDKTITLTCTSNGMRGGNVFANSYLAPIDVAKIVPEDDLEGIDGAFYLFNSGSWTQWQNNGGATNQMTGDGTSPGQYYAITPGSAAMIDASQDQTTIPPMQGVYVVALNNAAKIKLDYAKHVFGADASSKPMRAPQRQDDNFKRVRLQVSGKNSGADRMYVIQHNECTSGYDNGYDAKNMPVASQVSIYTSEVEGQMEISVSNKIDSTYIGFRAGADSEYTLRITSVVGERLYLKDLDNQTLISVYDGEEYTFSAEPNSVNDRRFLLLDQRSDDVSTDEPEVRVYVHDKMAHVLGAPIGSDMVIYTIGGVAITNYTIECTPSVVDLSSLPTGVYVLRINDKAFKCVCK